MLADVDRVFLLETLITIFRELLLNAVKANAKRVFFDKSGADINDQQAYDRVMNSFREDVVGDFQIMKDELQKSVYRVDFKIHREKNDFHFCVENNAAILPREQIRITERIENARRYKDFNDAFEEMYDDTEGAGLGIILTIMLLKNMGASADSFSITTDGKKTFTKLMIPWELKPRHVVTEISQSIVNEINILPTLPHFVAEIQAMCESPDASINKIADKIKTDPSLSADLLKLANSAGFVASKRIETINEAVMRIGLTNLKYLLLAAGARKIMDQRYKKFEAIWSHCMKTAYYARRIAVLHKMNDAQEKAFICGLLHDIGKIILLSIDDSLTGKIADFVQHHGLRTATILEEVSIGISHSSIGMMIARKWNFAPFISDVIGYHHSPLQIDPEYREVCFCVYMANFYCGIESRKYEYYYAEQDVLEYFKLGDEQKFNELHAKLKESFEGISQ
jgi:putative nucleotidyltransferase with HDIG domain